jgi:hypothetical protein
MPIDFTHVLKDLDGNDIMDIARKGDKAESVALTLSRVATNSLCGAIPNEKQVDGEEHLKRWLLAQKVNGNRAADLSVEEIAMIKDRLAKAYNNALVIGQSYTLLDAGAAAAVKKAA